MVGKRKALPAMTVSFLTLLLLHALIIAPGGAHAGAPVANAGADRSVSKNQIEGSVVALDGLASFDPEGNPLTYQWYGPFGRAQGPTPSVNIPEGSYTISLTVDNGSSQSAPDSAVISVTPASWFQPQPRATAYSSPGPGKTVQSAM